ncbi:MAG TPA: hypothetical protein VH519_13620 [Hyphomicrobiaceae bacterium]|jgi:hypothetical protein
MSYMLGGGQVIVGLVVLVAWWLALRLLRRLNEAKPLSSIGFAFWPSLLLIWLVGGCILMLRGIGAV